MADKNRFTIWASAIKNGSNTIVLEFSEDSCAESYARYLVYKPLLRDKFKVSCTGSTVEIEEFQGKVPHLLDRPRINGVTWWEFPEDGAEDNKKVWREMGLWREDKRVLKLQRDGTYDALEKVIGQAIERSPFVIDTTPPRASRGTPDIFDLF